MTHPARLLFDADFFKSAEQLRLRFRRAGDGGFHGQHASLHAGTGHDFVDRRDYVPGDDFRHIDWGVFARHGDLLLKRFREETDVPVYLFVDCSQSMAWEDGAKFDLARQAAASLGYLALTGLDRVSVLGFGAGGTRVFPLCRGLPPLTRLLEFLAELATSTGPTDLDAVVREFVQRALPQGVAILISDFFFPLGYEAALDRLWGAGFQVHLVQLYDETELCPERVGRYELVDSESGAAIDVTIDERLLAEYGARFRSFLSSLREYAQRRGMSLVQISGRSARYDEVVLALVAALDRRGR